MSNFMTKNDLSNISYKIVGVVGWCEDVMYLTPQGRPRYIVLHLGKACCPCSR